MHTALSTAVSAVASAVLGVSASAQLGGWNWTATGCAPHGALSAVLTTCGNGCDHYASLVTTAPDSGVIALHVGWTTKAHCCVDLNLSTTGPFGPQVNVFNLSGEYGYGWCAPSTPPCAGATSVAFPVKKGEQLRFVLNAIASDHCFDTPNGLTTVALSNWSFTPEVLPSVLNVDATFASSTQVIAIHGDNFEPASQVLLDGVPVPIASQTTDTLVIQPGVDAPGWRDVTVTNSAGSTTEVDAIERWPTLSAKIQHVSTVYHMPFTLRFGGGGNWWLAVSASVLASPLPLGPGIGYGLLLAPSHSLAIVRSGAIPPTTAWGVSYLEWPYDAALSGVAIPLQGFMQHSTGALSFTNLALPIAP